MNESAIAQLIAQVEPFIEQYGILGVFLLAFVEEVIVPIPSWLPLMGAGFFLLPAGVPIAAVMPVAILKIVIPAGIGFTLGGLLIYSIAYVGGKPLLVRWGRFFNLPWERVEVLQARLGRGRIDELIVFGLRAMPLVPNVAISAACGAVRYPLRSFLVASLFGSMVRAFMVGLLGWSVGEAYAAYAGQLTSVARYAGIALGVVLLAWIAWALVKRFSARPEK